MSDKLQELFDIAQNFGNVSLFQSNRDRTFSVNIDFMTSDHIELQAKSGFGCKTIEESLVKAIKKAVEIVGDVQSIPDVHIAKDYIKRLERQ